MTDSMLKDYMQKTRKNASKNVLVTLADKAYLEYAKQLFYSAYKYGGWDGDFLLLAHDVPEEELGWFKDRDIIIYKCRQMTVSRGRYSHPAMSKLYMFTTFFKSWKRAVYLDVDIIIRGDISYLTKLNGFNAAPDISTIATNFRIPDEKRNYKIYNALKDKFSRRGYFNSGVMAFETSMIKNDTFKTARETHRKLRDIVWGDNVILEKGLREKAPLIIMGDQTIINILFFNRWNPLPAAFNIYLGRIIDEGVFIRKKKLSINRKLLRPVVHCCSGHFKPWDKRCLFHDEWASNMRLAQHTDKFEKHEPRHAMSVKEIYMISKRVEKMYAAMQDNTRKIQSIEKILNRMKIYGPVIRMKHDIEKILGNADT